jgi:hypothetical protein
MVKAASRRPEASHDEKGLFGGGPFLHEIAYVRRVADSPRTTTADRIELVAWIEAIGAQESQRAAKFKPGSPAARAHRERQAAIRELIDHISQING